MTTVQDLTLGIKTVVATIPNPPSPVPVAPNSADIQSTSAFPSQHPSYREVAKKGQCVKKPDQTKQPKLQPPATYKQVPMKTQLSTTTQTEVQRCDISGPLHSTHMLEVPQRLEIITQRPVTKCIVI